MILTNLAAVVVAVAVVVVAAILISLLLELRRTAVVAREFISNLESDLKPSLKELQETLADVKIITAGAAENVDDLQAFIAAVGDAGRNVKKFSHVVGNTAEVLTRSSIWLTGAKVAGSVLLKKFTKKGFVSEICA